MQVKYYPASKQTKFRFVGHRGLVTLHDERRNGTAKLAASSDCIALLNIIVCLSDSYKIENDSTYTYMKIDNFNPADTLQLVKIIGNFESSWSD